jgi:hypothetical protein
MMLSMRRDLFAEYEAKWGKFNSILYKMCRTMPNHVNESEVRAKVVMIARAYAAGLERHVEDGLRGVAEKVVPKLVGAHRWLDADLAQLAGPAKDRVPRLELVETLTRIHGRFLACLDSVTRSGHGPRSFASKYLHFHLPVFPIYDSRTVARIRASGVGRWQRPWTEDHPKHSEADWYYWRHCVRIGYIVECWGRLTPKPTARNLDTWLLDSAGTPWG